MKVEISTRDLRHSARLEDHVREEIERELLRYQDRLTRVEVHIGDHNAKKGGADDKRCMMEARPKGRHPIAVEAVGPSVYEVVSDAAEKLRRALEHRLMRAAKRPASAVRAA